MAATPNSFAAAGGRTKRYRSRNTATVLRHESYQGLMTEICPELDVIAAAHRMTPKMTPSYALRPKFQPRPLR
jgi:hypothetical protein